MVALLGTDASKTPATASNKRHSQELATKDSKRHKPAVTHEHGMETAQPASADSYAVDYNQHLSAEGQLRQLASLRVLLSAFTGVPGIVGLHGGLPPPEAFPFTSMSFTTRDGTTVNITDPAQVAAAQQYSVTLRGYAPLVEWVHKHTWELHNPPGDHDLMITNGSNHSIEMLMDLLLNPGDTILCEEYCYPHMIESLVMPKGYVVQPVTIDRQGICPKALRKLLKEGKTRGKTPPRVLYTVPVGQNPTGSVSPVERKREVYQICREFDIVIIEDDPYYYLQFPTGGEPSGLQSLGISYLSLDTDGRVVRLDSFSKVLAPGLRLGWATAAPALLEKLIFHLHGSILGPTAMSQVVVSSLLNTWGKQGFENHVKDMQRGYARRAGILHDAAVEHLTGLAEWTAPVAGMFAWFKLGGGIRDADEVLEHLKEEKVVVVPGRVAHCDGPRPSFPCPYIRVSFASATDDDLREGVRRLACVIKRYQSTIAASKQSDEQAATGAENGAAANGHVAGSMVNGHAEAQATGESACKAAGASTAATPSKEGLNLHAATHTKADAAPEI